MKKNIASTAQRWELFTERTLKRERPRVKTHAEVIKKTLIRCLFSKQTLHVKSGRVDSMVTTYLWVGGWVAGWMYG